MKRSLTAFVAVMFATAALTLGSAAAAGALTQVEEREPTIEFKHSTTSTGFGDNWAINYQCDPCTKATTRVILTGFPDGYKPDKGSTEPDQFVEGWVRPNVSAAPLPVGTYSVTVEVDYESWDHTTRWVGSNTTELTITPAAVAGTLTVKADPRATSNMIMGAKLTGLLPGWSDYYVNGVSVIPGGTWVFSVADESGTEVFTSSVDLDAHLDPFVGSSYWMGAQPGQKYTVTATYVAGTTASGNVTVKQPAAVAIDGPAQSRPVPTSTAAPAPVQTATNDTNEFLVPVFALVALVALILGFSVLVVLLVVRQARASQSARGGEVADAEGNGNE
jgi:hypothetical protein